ncbi:MAG TPA: sigma-70 family RNA polymerase sigma factor [Nannocystaceae bacterium]|nr:sigma-70 family RNA polymerase sigma factor [Nannocystaceae bacterium]
MIADVELLERWRAGDSTAGEELFERYFDAMVRFFRNKLAEATDDLVQRTFLACVEGRDRLREDASFRSYLFGVAHNLLRKHFDRREAEPIDFTARSAFDLGPSPSSVAAKTQAEQILLDGLRRIPLDYQIALELHYWEELMAAEIADATAVPLGTAKTRLRRGRELLLEKVAELTRAMGDTTEPIDIDRRAREVRSRLLAM